MTTNFATELANSYDSIISRIIADVSVANGRRRTRTIIDGEVRRDVLEAIETGSSFRHGGHVANTYGYPAVATILLIRVEAGKIYWLAGTGNAKKGCTGVGRLDGPNGALNGPVASMLWDDEADLPGDKLLVAIAADACEDAGDARAVYLRKLAAAM